MSENMDELCARCGHERHRHDKIDNEVVYGWVGECLAPSCRCEGFIEDLDTNEPNTERSSSR